VGGSELRMGGENKGMGPPDAVFAGGSN